MSRRTTLSKEETIKKELKAIGAGALGLAILGTILSKKPAGLLYGAIVCPLGLAWAITDLIELMKLKKEQREESSTLSRR